MKLWNWTIEISLQLLLSFYLASCFSGNNDIFRVYPEKSKIQVTGSVAEFRCAIRQPNRYRLLWLVAFTSDPTTHLPVTQREKCFELTEIADDDLILKVHVQSNVTGAYWCRAIDTASGCRIDGHRVLLQATDLPSRSRQPKAVVVNESTIVVWWRPSVNTSFPIVGYEVQYSTNDSLHWHQLIEILSTDLLYWHHGLDPNTKYRYRVRALTKTGHSKWSHPTKSLLIRHFRTKLPNIPGINSSNLSRPASNEQSGASNTPNPSGSNIVFGSFDSMSLALEKPDSSASRFTRSFRAKNPTVGDSKREGSAIGMLLFAFGVVVCFIIGWVAVRYCWSRIYKHVGHRHKDNCIIEIDLSNGTGKSTARKTHESNGGVPVLCESVAYNLVRYSVSHEGQPIGNYVFLSAEEPQVPVEAINSNSTEETILTDSVAYNVPSSSASNDQSGPRREDSDVVEIDLSNENRKSTAGKSHESCNDEAPVLCDSVAYNLVSHEGQSDGNYVFLPAENGEPQLPVEAINSNSTEGEGMILIDSVAYNVPSCPASNDYGDQNGQKDKSNGVIEIDLSDHSHRDVRYSGTDELGVRKRRMQQKVNHVAVFCKSTAYNVVTYSATIEHDYCECEEQEYDSHDVVEIDLSDGNQRSQRAEGNGNGRNTENVILYESEAYNVVATSDGENRKELQQEDSDVVEIDLSRGTKDTEVVVLCDSVAYNVVCYSDTNDQ